jgi:hypothetical protein
LKTEQIASQDQVAGGRYWKKLGEALQRPEDESRERVLIHGG